MWAKRRSPEAEQGEVGAAAVLSDREKQVLASLVRGLSMKQVARELGITPRTVAFHKYNAMGNNGLQSNAELVSFALRHGLLPLVPRASNLAGIGFLLASPLPETIAAMCVG
jgi:DNA-binding CsgD family transcriptional regulator